MTNQMMIKIIVSLMKRKTMTVQIMKTYLSISTSQWKRRKVTFTTYTRMSRWLYFAKRILLQNYLRSKGKDKVLNLQWRNNFKSKYKNIINVLKIHFLENKRFDVSREQIDDYFDRLAAAISKCPFPPTIINVDIIA